MTLQFFFFFLHNQGRQSFYVKSYIVNILGFVGQEAKLRLLHRYLYKERDSFLIKIKSQNFHKFAIWTDFLDDYRCVEPCYNGKSFVKDGEPHILKKDQTFKASMKIEIEE